MKRLSALVLAAVTMALASLACTIDLPSLPFGPQIEIGEPGQFKIGPEQTEAIEVPASGSSSSLRLQFAVGTLHLSGGGEKLLTGEATYNVDQLKPIVDGAGGSWTVRTGDVKGFSAVAAAQLVNTWDLLLGPGPVDLALELGAAKAEVDLGGVSVTRLEMNSGASDIKLSYSEPNPVGMDSFTAEVGAAHLDFSRLANFNTSRMNFKLGGGDVSLDFSGDLAQDLSVTIESAAGNFTITVPEGTAASLSTSGGFISINPEGGWKSSGDGYVQEGNGPEINIAITAGAGNVNLRTN